MAGTRSGPIAEGLERTPPEFVNPYEQTKWEAERLTAAAGLPTGFDAKRRVMLDRRDAAARADDFGQERRVIAGAGTDLQHPLAKLARQSYAEIQGEMQRLAPTIA